MPVKKKMEPQARAALTERTRLGRYRSCLSGRGVAVTVPSEYVALTGLGSGTVYEVYAEPDGSLLFKVARP